MSVRRELMVMRRRLLWLAGLLGVLLLAGLLGARPAYRQVKKWRAVTLTAKADELYRQQRHDDAFKGYRAALELNPAYLPALRGMARILTQLEMPAAFGYWRPVLRSAEATDEDRDGYITLALRLLRFDLANEEVAALLQQDPPSDAALIHAMELFQVQGDYRRASGFAEALWRRDMGNNNSALRLALAQIRLPGPTNRAFAVQLLAGRTNLTRLERAWAFNMLRQAPDLPREETRTVLESLRGAMTNYLGDQLIMADIEIRLEPERREALVEQILAAHPAPTPAEKRELAAWLLVHQQHERLLALIPPAEAQADGDLMRLRLIALSVRGNWAQIERELANPGVMDPLLVDVFRAVTARERNQPVLAAEHWRRAAEETQASPDERRRFAAIALQLRAYDQALPAVQALLRSPLDRLRALRQLVQIYEATGNLEGVRSVMRDWAKDAPDDPTPRTAFVYLCGLMRRDIPEAEAQGRELVERYPDRAAVRAALALVLLRRDNPVDALEQFARIRPELDLALPGWRAVYAAVLDANGQPEQARAILRPVKPEMLRPEERQLVEKLLSTGG